MSNHKSWLELHVSLFEKRQQRVLVLPTIKPPLLVRSILQEFRGLEHLGQQVDEYVLVKFVNGHQKKVLKLGIPLGKQVNNGDHLGLIEIVPSRALQSPTRLYLRELTSGTLYKLHRLPAVIGRWDGTTPQAQTVAVNLQEHSQGLRVSRCHAIIDGAEGGYFIKRMSNNPTSIRRDGKTRPVPEERQQLLSGDIIRLERSNIELKFSVRQI